MTEQKCSSVDKLSKVIRHMQKCLVCVICLHTVSKPVKTHCGHSFCRECISPILSKKNGTCPLCKVVLKRRNVSNDEGMEMYANALQKLIDAIRMDTGINILSHSTRPHDTNESSALKANDSRESDTERNIHGNKDTNTPLKIPVPPRSKIVANDEGTSITRKGPIFEHHKRKKSQAETVEKKKQLANCDIPGCKPLCFGDSDDSDHENETESKVRNWLKDSSNHEPLDDPNRETVSVTNDSTLDDTVIASISDIYADTLDNKLDRHRGSAGNAQRFEKNADDETLCGTTKNCSLDSSSRNENNESGKHRRITKHRTLGAKKSNSTTTNLKFKGIHSRVHELDEHQANTSTSNADKKGGGSPEGTHDQESSPDVRKAESADMLPSAKKNWSSVVQFGKEMRIKKRKLKSLSVSIESGHKSKLSGEPTEKGLAKSRLIDDTTRQKAVDSGIGKEANTLESTANRSVDKCRLEMVGGLPNAESTDSNPRNTEIRRRKISSNCSDDESPSKGHRDMPSTPCLISEEGEKIPIINLNNNQLEDVIGIKPVSESRVTEKNPLSLKKRGNRSANSSRITPVKNVHEEGHNLPDGARNNYSKVCVSPSNDNLSPSQVQRIGQLSEIFSSEDFRSAALTETPVHGRLSLKNKGSTGRKSKGSSSSNGKSRLMAVTRDLTEEMSRSKGKTIDNGNALNSRRKIQEEHRENNEQEDLRVTSKVSAGPSKAEESIKRVNKQPSAHFVAFKKLGKVFKQRKNATVKFIYLGSTRRAQIKNLTQYNSLIRLQKPSNPIDFQTMEIPSTSGNSFVNNNRVTLNETVIPANEEVKNNLPSSHSSNDKAKIKSASRENNVSRYSETISVNSTQSGASLNKQTLFTRDDSCKVNESKKVDPPNTSSKFQDSFDVILVSLENEEDPQQCKKESPGENKDGKSNERSIIKSPARKSSLMMNGIKLLSPEKDSQLKFLSTDSPLPERPQETKLVQRLEVSKDHSPNKTRSNFIDVKGTYSRALIRKSQGASSESGEADTSDVSKRKRKRSTTEENLSRGAKRISRGSDEDSRQDDESDSQKSFSSLIAKVDTAEQNHTPRRKDNQAKSSKCNASRNLPAGLPMSDQDTIDVEALLGSTGRRKKAYKRIITDCATDTDSTEVISLGDEQPDTNVETNEGSPSNAKRKQLLTLDSNEAMSATAILNKWGREAEMLEMYHSKGNAEQATVGNSKTALQDRANDNLLNSRNPSFSNLANVPVALRISRDTSTAGDIFESGMTTVREFEPKGNTISEDVEMFSDKDSPSFNAIIDRVREIQRLGSSSDNNPAESDVNRKATKEPSLMQDNFDEVIANVDTQALMDEFRQKERTSRNDGSKRKRRSIEQVGQKAPTEFADKIESLKISQEFGHEHTSLPRHSNSSDKENNVMNKKPGRIHDTRQTESDGDKTLTQEDLVVSDKGLSRKDDSKCNRSFTKTKSFELESNKESHKVDNVSKRPSEHNSPRLSPDIDEAMLYKTASNNHESTLKESSDDPDSLTNITHQQLMFQQFEDDLFGKSPSTARVSNTQLKDNTSADKQQTPRKGTEMNAGRGNVHVTEAEYSGEEDDIVENTPDVKMKNGEGVKSVTRRILVTPTDTSTSKITDAHTPQRADGFNSNATPASCKRNIYPLYHSTPNVSSTVTENAVLKGSSDTLTESDGGKFCFVCTGLTSNEIDVVKRLAHKYNAKYVSQFDNEVTHVIVKTDEENNGANKTLKYLQGIAHRKWIVGFQWVVDSLREEKLINEEPYEAVDIITLEAGPRNSRLRQRDLFQGFAFLCIGPYSDVTVDQYKDLLLVTGATVVESLKDLANIKNQLKAIVVQSDEHEYEVIEWYRKARAVTIVHEWIVTCISQYKLVSFYPFLQELSQEEVLALGYPPYLVEEEPEEEPSGGSDYSSCEY